jgi:protein SDA1
VGVVSLRDLIDFISHVADCYPAITKGFAGELIDLLKAHHEVLESELREKIVGSLVLLRKKDVLGSSEYVYFRAWWQD